MTGEHTTKVLCATRFTCAIANGKVREMSFGIPFKSHPEARDTLLDLFMHKWGTPKTRDEEGKQTMVFRDEEPRVEAREEGGAWHFEIR